MNHELLLKTELPVNQASSVRSQTVPDSQDRAESEPYKAFSSELDKQIDKQVPQSKSGGVIAKGSEQSASVKSANEAKAEIILDKNGNPLPTEKEIAQELTSQLLGDFEGDQAIKKELTQIIEQFVHSIVNSETPDVDLKDSVTGFIEQLLKSGIGSDKSLVLPNTDNVKTGLKSAISGVSDIAKIIDPALTTATQNSAASSAKSESAQKLFTLDTVEHVQSVIQKIKDLVIKEVSAKTDEKGGEVAQGDKTQLISGLVKQLLGIGPAEEKVSKQVASVDSVDKGTAGGTALRSGILQALTSKASAVTTDNNALNTKTTSATTNNEPLLTITNNFLKGEVTSANADEKHIDRITQLVDLLKPAKSDEQLVRTTILDKAAPAVSSPPIATTPLAAANTITKAELPSLDIQPSLQSKAWNNVLSSRVIWMAREGIQQAALKLNPANLGPVEVRINMHNEQANITFIAHNAATRDALEQALPRLRESFSENGLELTDAEVSDPTSQQTKDDDREQDGEDIKGGAAEAAMIEKTNENAEQAATLITEDIDLGLSVYA
jgi:flagellar hook-length control protein FliK